MVVARVYAMVHIGHLLQMHPIGSASALTHRLIEMQRIQCVVTVSLIYCKMYASFCKEKAPQSDCMGSLLYPLNICKSWLLPTLGIPVLLYST